MSILDKIHEARVELNKKLEDIEAEQKMLKNEIMERRNVKWEKMFDDLYSLKKYSSFTDTGVNLYAGKTLGFEIRDHYICVIAWEHLDCMKNPIEPQTGAYFFCITRDNPFDTNSHFASRMEYVIKAIEDWDNVMEEIKVRLVRTIKTEMNNKILEVDKTQVNLENQLRNIL